MLVQEHVHVLSAVSACFVVYMSVVCLSLSLCPREGRVCVCGVLERHLPHNQLMALNCYTANGCIE